MKSRKPIDPKTTLQIDELVEWGAKTKDIVYLLRDSDVQEAKLTAYVRYCYEQLGRRPPNGLTASPAKVRITLRRHYTLMCTDYMNLIKRGVGDMDAILAAYRWHWQRVRSPALGDRCDPGTWFQLVRGLKKRQYKLLHCDSCRAASITNLDATRLNYTCIWCNSAFKLAAHTPSAVRLA